MPVPVLKQGDILIASVQAALSDKDLLQLREDLADQVGRFRTRGVIIDVTTLDVLDSFATRTIRGITDSTRLRGARTVVVGIQPDVAFAMVQLGLSLEGVATALDLEEGLALFDAPLSTLPANLRVTLVDAEVQVPIETEADIVLARQKGRELAARTGFSRTDQTLIATAISEVARNIMEYARRGEITLKALEVNGRRGIEVVARDQGPGIADIELALQDGYSTGNSLGVGLPGVRRLMDEFNLESVLGRGTTVQLKKWGR